MEASGGRSRMRLIVVDFLATLFITFCIGVATAIVLAACVMLMTADARGAAPARPRPASATRGVPAVPSDLVMAHYLAAQYVGLVAVDRIYAVEPARADEDTGRIDCPPTP